MSQDRMTNSAVSIVVNLYTGILKGVPNLFHIMIDAKESSYYKEHVTESIERTGNAVTIAADDVSTRALEVKLQEKGIYFEKITSSAVSDYIKTNGAYVFILREEDFLRIYEAVEEVKKDFAKNSDDIEVEYDDDLEREREDNHTDDSEIAPENTTDEEPTKGEGDESEDTADENDSSKEKKKSPPKRDASKERYSEPPTQPYNDDTARREEARLREEMDRYERNRAENNSKEAQRREQEYHQQTSDQYASGIENHRTETQKRIDAQEESENRYKREQDYRNQREESSSSQNQSEPQWQSEKKSAYDPGTSNQEEARKHEAQRKAAADSNLDKSANFGTGQVERGRSTEEVRNEEKWISKPQTDVITTSAAKAQRDREDTYEATYPESHKGDGYSRPDGNNSSSQPYMPRTEISQKQENAQEKSFDTKKYDIQKEVKPDNSNGVKGHHPERDLLAQGRKDVQTTFGGHYDSQTLKQTETTKVSVLGNANDISVAQSSGVNMGSSISTGMHSRQSEVFQSKNAALQTDMSESCEAKNNTHMKSRSITNASEFRKRIHVEPALNSELKGEINKKPTDFKRVITISKTRCDFNNNNDVNNNSIKLFNNNTSDVTQKGLGRRRMYQMRDVLSPKNFRQVFSGTRRIVTQTVVSRDTEAGRMANNVTDFTSPIAMQTSKNFLKKGAISYSRGIKCDLNILTAAYAVKNNMSLNEAKKELRTLHKLEAKLVRAGKIGITLDIDAGLMNQLREVNILSGNNIGFMNLISTMNDEAFLNFMKKANLSEGLINEMLTIPKKDLNSVKIQSLMKKFNCNNDKAFLDMMRAKALRDEYRGGGFGFLARGYILQVIKRMAQQSDAGAALSKVFGVSSQVYHTYMAGVRLIFAILDKFKVVDPNIAVVKVMKEPLKVLRKHTFSVTKTAVSKTAGRVTATKFGTAIKNGRTAKHATSALKFLTHPLKPLKVMIMKTAIMQKLSLATSALSAKVTSFVASVAVPLGWILVVIFALLLLISAIQSTRNSAIEDSAPKNYNFAQDTEIVQELIAELTAKNEAFIADINNAAHNRGSFSTTAGLTASENVSFYETGAYNIVFRDAYGNELEPTHVDLNNTKAILSMAAKFMPYPFQKSSDNASTQEKKAYEDLKQHYKDYCYFLWASTHQISLEEYHPGNSSEIEGAVDNSGLITTLDKGTCDQDGTTLWLEVGFTKNVVRYGSTDWICESCADKPATGMGDYYDDLCTHGKDVNPHGGWRMTGNKRQVLNCHADHRHSGCNHSEDEYYCDTCTLGDCIPATHEHWEYEWVYECGGHMGSVIYVTVGDLSRMPGFGAAKDVDYDAVGEYDTGESIFGSGVVGGITSSGTAFKGRGYSLSDDQIRYITALCIKENGRSINAIAFEASLIANLTDMGTWGSSPWTVAQSSWFASASKVVFSQSPPPGNVNGVAITNEMLAVVKDVLVNGNRTTKANEHDCLSDIISVTNNGVSFNKTDRSQYISGVTIITNKHGVRYVFECFPSASSDPFGVIIN